jgi:FHA domain
MNQNPVLRFLSGPQEGQEFVLSPQEITLGRGDENMIKIAWDTSISRYHARIFKKSGLLWAEDLNSKNGSSLLMPDDQEISMQPHEPHLLLDHVRLRFGKHVEFEILGIAASEEDAMRTVIGGVRDLLQSLYEGLPYLEPQIRKEQITLIRRFEEGLLKAADEEELLRIAVDGFNTLHETRQEIVGPLIEEGDDKPLQLAPIPDDLPDPSDPDRLFTIRGIFISDIRKCIPNNNQEENSYND